jgi:hypothetical protein
MLCLLLRTVPPAAAAAAQHLVALLLLLVTQCAFGESLYVPSWRTALQECRSV